MRRALAVVLVVAALGGAGCNSILGNEDHSLAPGAGPGLGCTEGTRRCSGNTPQECAGSIWQDQTPCGGSTPVCSNGLCGTYRTTGGILSTVASPVAADGGIHLVSGGFELGARSCDEAGVCVTGGLVP